MASAARERTRMSLSPSPNKSKYHLRRALKLTAVILVVVLVFRWRYSGQPAPLLHAAAVHSERIEEEEPLATVHIYNREEEELIEESQVNEGSMAPSHLDENSSGSTQSSIPSFLDYYNDDKSANGDLDPSTLGGDDSAEDKNGFFDNIFNIFAGREESVEEGVNPEGGNEGKIQGENATAVLADGPKVEGGGLSLAGTNQSSVAELSKNTTGEREELQDSKGAGEDSANGKATKAEDDVNKGPSEVQPSIVPDTEGTVVENNDVETATTDTEQIAESVNSSAIIDAETGKSGENGATSERQEEVVSVQAQDVEEPAEPQEYLEIRETELPTHEETELPKQEEIEPPKHEDTELPKHEETELPKHEETELPKQEKTELPKQEETELPKQEKTELPKQEETEFPKQEETELPKQEETEPPKHTDVIEDSIGRLGDLIGGIRDVVEVLKKNRATPEGGEVPQQQQHVGNAEGNLTSSKHEALKPGGKLHGHIDELLTLTGHLTDLLRESQGKGKEEQDDLLTKDDAEGILQPASQNQGTDVQNTQMVEPIALPANQDEPIAPLVNPNQVKVLEVTPIEPMTQDENKQEPETVPEAFAPLDVKENPQEPVMFAEKVTDTWLETTTDTVDEEETEDTVKRASEPENTEPVANDRFEPESPLQNPETNLHERDRLYVEPGAAVQEQEVERIHPAITQQMPGEGIEPGAELRETGTLQEQTHGRVEPVAIVQEGERLEPVDAGREEEPAGKLQEQAGNLVEPVAILQEEEQVEPVDILQEQGGEQILEKQGGEPMQPVASIQEGGRVEPENTLQEQAGTPVEPAGVVQEVGRVEPVVDGIRGGEQAEQVNTLQEHAGERLEPGNTVPEETGVRSGSADALRNEGELIEPANAALEPAAGRLETAYEIREPSNERAEPVPALQEPKENAEEQVPLNREPVSEGKANGDQVDHVNNMLANLKNMVHGLHSRLENIRTKNQENATGEPEENRLSGNRISEPNDPQTYQVNAPLRSQNHYLEPENQRLEIENHNENQDRERENNGIDGGLVNGGGGGGGEKESERSEGGETATGERQNTDEENARKIDTRENEDRKEKETETDENEQERQLQTYKEGEKVEEERITEGIIDKGNEAAWQEDRRRRLREACRSRNPETDESVNATLYRSLYIQRSHTLVCAVPKAGLDTWKRTIEGLTSKGQSHDDQTRSFSSSSPPLRDLASLDLYTKIITVKHPMARLFSSFLSKYHGGNLLPPFPGQQGDMQTAAGQEWVENYRLYWLPALQINELLPVGLHLRLGLSNPLNADTRYEPEVYERLHEHLHPNISFTNFVRFVVHTFRSGTQRPDWASYESSCSPCRVQYDHVAKVETLEEDLAFISKELSLPTTLDPEEAFVEARRAAATLELSLKYYKLLPVKLRDELLQYLRPDMELFGYKAPLAMLPSSGTPS